MADVPLGAATGLAVRFGAFLSAFALALLGMAVLLPGLIRGVRAARAPDRGDPPRQQHDA